ncbi:MAG: response regulator [Actinomycetota bacterium]|nr:response regulator [Actinomycetota bacterium]
MKPCALIVDDDCDMLRLVELTLKKLGIEVLLSDEGPEALRLARDEHPDVILLDIMMPGMDGYELMQRLKAGEDTRDIPVIMLTAKSHLNDRKKSEEMGAAGYITKPFRLENLRNLVQGLTCENPQASDK